MNKTNAKEPHIIKVKNFSPEAKSLRSEFDRKFANPLEGSSDRFVWDYWHVPGQYSLCRTPADHYFPEKAFESFQNGLLKFGREVLGCCDITPPWLSYYVDSCSQEMHADVPHGPWAFVFSLTPWQKRRFSGGETFIFKPQTLNYWRSFSSYNGVEQKDLVTLIEPEFNQLLVFDPRLPHGVKEVKGTKDPREARLVIHGWFKDPEPYVEGGHSQESVVEVLNQFLTDEFEALLEDHSDCHGTLSLRISVEKSGQVVGVKVLTNTLLSLLGDSTRPRKLTQNLLKPLKGLEFKKAAHPSEITLPLLFRF